MNQYTELLQNVRDTKGQKRADLVDNRIPPMAQEIAELEARVQAGRAEGDPELAARLALRNAKSVHESLTRNVEDIDKDVARLEDAVQVKAGSAARIQEVQLQIAALDAESDGYGARLRELEAQRSEVQAEADLAELHIAEADWNYHAVREVMPRFHQLLTAQRKVHGSESLQTQETRVQRLTRDLLEHGYRRWLQARGTDE